MHESQSKLWENHVARNPRVRRGARRGAGARAVRRRRPRELHAALVGVEPSLIRVSADPLTYPLHIILRFELELALIEGELAVADLPAAWRERHAPAARRRGPLRRARLPAGRALGRRRFGYFPSYALGCLIAAQLWEAMEAELGPREEDLRRGRGRCRSSAGSASTCTATAAASTRCRWSSSATGRALEVEPFLRYVAPLAGR